MPPKISGSKRITAVVNIRLLHTFKIKASLVRFVEYIYAEIMELSERKIKPHEYIGIYFTTNASVSSFAPKSAQIGSPTNNKSTVITILPIKFINTPARI